MLFRSTPLAKGWRDIVRVNEPGLFKSEILNKAITNPKGLTILQAVEAGAAPHRMRPRPAIVDRRGRVRAGTYAFFNRGILNSVIPGGLLAGAPARRPGQTRTIPSFLGRQFSGQVIDRFLSRRGLRRKLIFSQSINHPGMRGFHMVQIAQEDAQTVAQAMAFKVQGILINALEHGLKADVSRV